MVPSQWKRARRQGKGAMREGRVILDYDSSTMTVSAGAFVSAIRVTFVRLEGGRLNPGDYYRSEWLGRPTGRPTRMLDA